MMSHFAAVEALWCCRGLLGFRPCVLVGEDLHEGLHDRLIDDATEGEVSLIDVANLFAGSAG